MVVMIHASSDIYHALPLQTPAFFAVNFLASFSRTGVPLFFMLTGALMLSREKLDTRKLLVSHALYLTGIYYLWSLIYALGARLAAGELGSFYDFCYSVAAGHYHLWFLPAMVMCYLFLPPVSAAVHGKELDAKYLLGLFFGIVLLCANLNLTPDTALVLNRITLNFSLDYLPYLGYVIWGWWLAERSYSRRTLRLAPLILLAVTIAASCANLWYSHYKGVADGWLFSYFSLPVFVQASCVFCFCLALKDHSFRSARVLAALADCTMGVYLIHPLMINVFERFGLAADISAPAGSLLLSWLLLCAVCFALVYCARRIPFMRKLI